MTGPQTPNRERLEAQLAALVLMLVWRGDWGGPVSDATLREWRVEVQALRHQLRTAAGA